jgi:hypothetical protein
MASDIQTLKVLLLLKKRFGAKRKPFSRLRFAKETFRVFVAKKETLCTSLSGSFLAVLRSVKNLSAYWLFLTLRSFYE